VIRYALACEHDHPFEAWFASSEDYDGQAERGLVECPFCGSRQVRKQIMAPAVAGTRKAGTASPAEAHAAMIAAMGRVRAHVEQNFDYVGDRFAREARRMHEGEAESRAIYGEATRSEVKALAEDGVPVAPLPPAAAPRPKESLN
jgi:hypothetical protein